MFIGLRLSAVSWNLSLGCEDVVMVIGRWLGTWKLGGSGVGVE